jgi:hypothetical protein
MIGDSANAVIISGYGACARTPIELSLQELAGRAVHLQTPKGLDLLFEGARELDQIQAERETVRVNLINYR